MDTRSGRHAPIREAATAEAFCFRLGDTIRNLKSVLEKETTLMRQHKISQISVLQPDKSSLSAAFQTELLQLRSQASALSRLAPVPLAGLRKDLAVLDDVLSENHNLLESGLNVSKSIARRIAEKTTELTSGPAVYGSGTGAPSRPATPAAIAVDCKL
jgi:hypothetical protein